MREIFIRACIALFLVAPAVIATSATAEEREGAGPSIAASMGFTADPGGFLLVLALLGTLRRGSTWNLLITNGDASPYPG